MLLDQAFIKGFSLTRHRAEDYLYHVTFESVRTRIDNVWGYNNHMSLISCNGYITIFTIYY